MKIIFIKGEKRIFQEVPWGFMIVNMMKFIFWMSLSFLGTWGLTLDVERNNSAVHVEVGKVFYSMSNTIMVTEIYGVRLRSDYTITCEVETPEMEAHRGYTLVDMNWNRKGKEDYWKIMARVSWLPPERNLIVDEHILDRISRDERLIYGLTEKDTFTKGISCCRLYTTLNLDESGRYHHMNVCMKRIEENPGIIKCSDLDRYTCTSYTGCSRYYDFDSEEVCLSFKEIAFRRCIMNDRISCEMNSQCRWVSSHGNHYCIHSNTEFGMIKNMNSIK